MEPYTNDSMRKLIAELGLDRPSREMWRLEHDGRTLACRQHHDGQQPWLIIANEDDWTRQSVVLTNQEYRWLAWEGLSGRYNQDWWDGRPQATAILLRAAARPHLFIEQTDEERNHAVFDDPDACAVCRRPPEDPLHEAGGP